jgi:hypothetical protein
MNSTDIIPAEIIMSANDSMNSRLSDFIQKHNLTGNVTYGQVAKIDKKFSEEVKEFVSLHEFRIWKKYKRDGAHKGRLEIDKTMKPKSKSKSKRKKNQKAKSKAELKEEAKNLIKVKDITILSSRKINTILNHGELEYKEIEPYYIRLQELKKITVNYNKPNALEKAKALVTQFFGEKRKPLSYIDFEEIILARLYCAKKGLEYLKNKDIVAYQEVLKEAGPKIDEVLNKMDYKSLDDINF